MCCVAGVHHYSAPQSMEFPVTSVFCQGLNWSFVHGDASETVIVLSGAFLTRIEPWESPVQCQTSDLLLELFVKKEQCIQ